MNGLRYNCAGMARRDFLQLGLGAVMGLGFTDLLRYRARAAEAAMKAAQIVASTRSARATHARSARAPA